MSKIVLFDNRPKKMALYSLNLKVYLGREVEIIKELEEFDQLLSHDNEIELIITAECIKGKENYKEIKKLLKNHNIDFPIIVLVQESNWDENKVGKIKNKTEIKESDELRPLIKCAANLLEVTAQQMAAMKIPPYFPIESYLLKNLLHYPCHIYKKLNDDYSVMFNKNDSVDLNELESFQQENKNCYITSLERVQFANSFSEQLIKLNQDLNRIDSSTVEKVNTLNKSIDIISSRVENDVIDEEVVEIAKSSIKSMANVVKNTPQISKLLSVLLSDKLSFRYKHCQLLIFITLKALKNLKKDDEETVNAFTQAGFFHDIFITDDHMARVSTEKELNTLILTKKQKDMLLSHALRSSNLVEKMPDSSPLAVKMIKEHHGSAAGIGLNDSVREISYFSKLFFHAEHLVQVILAEKEEIDTEKHLATVRESYNDKESQEIFDSFINMEIDQIVDSLTNDFNLDEVLGLDDDLEISGPSNDQENDEKIVSAHKSEISPMVQLSHLNKSSEDWVRIPGQLQEDIGTVTFIVDALKEEVNESEMTVIHGIGCEMLETVRIVSKMSEEELANNMDIKVKLEDLSQKTVSFMTEISNKSQKSLRETVNDRLKGGVTLGMIAALKGSARSLEMLRNYGADFRLRDVNGRDSLHYAAMGGSVNVINICLRLKLNINSQDSKRRTPLFYAISNGHIKAGQFLINHGARGNIKVDKGMSLAMLAAHKGDLDALELVIKAGANINTRDDKGKSAYGYAVARKNVNVIEYLKEHGLSN